VCRKYNFISEEEQDFRLDKLLLNYLSADPSFDYVTRSQIRQWIKGGKVQVNAKVVCKAGFTVKAGSTVEVNIPLECSDDLEAYDFPLKVVYEDSSIIVIDKPPGIAMHPGAGNRSETVLNALAARLKKGSEEFPDPQRLGIVHRLDKDTTGLVVIAKNLKAHNYLTRQFLDRTITRSYKALVYCTPRRKRVVQLQESGKIETLLGRHPSKRTQMAVVEAGGRLAITEWKQIEVMEYGVLLDIKLQTGRTHQIRVHMDSIGCPVVGDPTYGDYSGLPEKLLAAARKFGRQALHAYKLQFRNPETKQKVIFEEDLPQDLKQLLEVFRGF
jgi:23S rRNA pseudouridine1911/1915/1917 synthase